MISLSNTFSALRDNFLARFPWRIILVICVGSLIWLWMSLTPEGLLGKADAVGYAVCHRIEARSFFIGTYQFSVCARCSGQYLGAVLGFLFLGIFRPRRSARPPWLIIGLLLLGAAAYALDGFNSFLHLIPWAERFWLYEPNNTLRLITGTMMGLSIGIMLFPAFNQTIWQRYDHRPVLDGWRDFGSLLLLAGILVLLVLTENPIILYPLSLISAGGVLMLLTIVYAMVWMMLFRFENRITQAHQLFFPLLAGFAVALAQVLLIDSFRYWLTGTWGAFPLG